MFTHYQDVLNFWYNDENRPYWFTKSDDFDTRIAEQFSLLWQQACYGELNHWRTHIKGRLAEIIVLDQFSRNLKRNNSR